MPLIITGSALAVLPSGVAKAISCPASPRIFQLTATSLGSKSWRGSGINTLMAAAYPRSVHCRNASCRPLRQQIAVHMLLSPHFSQAGGLAMHHARSAFAIVRVVLCSVVAVVVTAQ